MRSSVEEAASEFPRASRKRRNHIWKDEPIKGYKNHIKKLKKINGDKK